MEAEQLSPGTSGNISMRDSSSGLIAISPSGLEYKSLTHEDIVIIDLDGKIVEGSNRPSSEMDFHLALYRGRSDCQAVVHTHSHFATTLACLGKELPAVHYMIAYAGEKVPLANYHTFGTPELAQEISKKIQNYYALLMENHGVLAIGPSLKYAYNCAASVEFVAQIYLQAMQVGTPKILSSVQMQEVMAKFKNYGQK